MNPTNLAKFAESVASMNESLNAAITTLTVFYGQVNEINAQLERELDAKIKPETIIEICGEFFESSPAQIKSATRQRPHVNARQYAITLIKKYNDYLTTGPLSLKQIGRIFGGRDHSTVIHARTQVQALVATYDHEKTIWNALCALLDLRLGISYNQLPVENCKCTSPSMNLKETACHLCEKPVQFKPAQ